MIYLPNKRYRKGYRFENALLNRLKKEGYDAVVRTAGSHSPYDIIAIKDAKLFLIQCKANDITPYELLRVRKKMCNIARELTVVECLAYKKKGKTLILPLSEMQGHGVD